MISGAYLGWGIGTSATDRRRSLLPSGAAAWVAIRVFIECQVQLGYFPWLVRPALLFLFCPTPLLEGALSLQLNFKFIQPRHSASRGLR